MSVSSLARRIAIGAAALAVIACDAESPTGPTRIATPSEPLLTLTGGAGTRIFPIVAPGEFQPIGFAVGLNNAGQVVGTGRLVPIDDQNKPYRWTPGAGAVKLLGCCDIQFGVDINDAGVVVGSEQVDAVAGWRGFVATGTTMVRLSILPGAPVDGDAHAYAVNNAGQIVGLSVSPDRSPHAVLWSPAGWIHDLGTLGGSRSAAVDINASAQVIGRSQIVGDAATRYFLWSPGTGMQDLNATINPNITSVVEINDAGQIVGTYTAPGGQSHAFRYTPGAGLQDLGTLGGTFSEPTGLNGRGDVVGTSAIADGTAHAFLWTEAEGMEDITAVTGIPEVRRLNDDLQTLTGTAPPTAIITSHPNVTARLVQLQVTQANTPPIALFTWSCTGTVCTLDASSSTDDKGIVSYDWVLGKNPDGTASGVTVTTDYWHASTRTVTLTVTDADGASSSITKTFDVSTDAPPVARFAWSCSGTVCTLDASTSTDDVGITSYDWTLGKEPDGTASGVIVTTDYWHTSTRTVTLMVMDTKGQTNSVTQTVTVP